MAAKVISDNVFDQDLIRKKELFARLQKDTQAFITNHSTLPPKERAKQLLSIQSGIRDLQKFLSAAHAHEINNAGTRFTYESLKSSFGSYWGRWIKFERSLG